MCVCCRVEDFNGALVHAYPEVSSQFGGTPTLQVVGLLLLAFIGVVIFGILARVLHSAVHVAGFGPLNRLLGLLLGLIMGTIVCGGVVWVLETYAVQQAAVMLHGSALASPAKEFFEAVMGFTQRMFPRPEPQIPWWQRPWW